MSTKMKGLLKGLRYIQQIFEEQGEKELQIGFPTDVKHVAHIGWDGPTSNSSPPSWISSFKSEGDSNGEASSNVDAQDVPRVRDPRLPGKEKRVSAGGSDSPLESPSSRRRSDKHKGSRKHSHLGPSSLDSPRRSSTSENRTTKLLPLELDSPARDSASSSSSKTRKKKSKGSSSRSSSKSKHVDPTTNDGSSYSDPGSNV